MQYVQYPFNRSLDSVIYEAVVPAKNNFLSGIKFFYCESSMHA